MASNQVLGGAKVASGVEVCLLTLLLWRPGPLANITVDLRPYESGSDETSGGSDTWV